MACRWDVRCFETAHRFITQNQCQHQVNEEAPGKPGPEPWLAHVYIYIQDYTGMSICHSTIIIGQCIYIYMYMENIYPQKLIIS